MQLRRTDVAGLSGLADHLTALDHLAALDVELAVVGVSRDEAVGMADQDQVAVTLELAARVGDRAVFGGPDRGAFGNGDVDAVVAAGLEALNDAAARGPAEFGRGSGVGRLAGDRRDPRSANVSGRGRIDGALLRRGLVGFEFGHRDLGGGRDGGPPRREPSTSSFRSWQTA